MALYVLCKLSLSLSLSFEASGHPLYEVWDFGLCCFSFRLSLGKGLKWKLEEMMNLGVFSRISSLLFSSRSSLYKTSFQVVYYWLFFQGNSSSVCLSIDANYSRMHHVFSQLVVTYNQRRGCWKKEGRSWVSKRGKEWTRNTCTNFEYGQKHARN
jgi:hypothetical protein